MTAVLNSVRSTDPLPTTHAGLLAWVAEVARLTKPDAVVWIDGSAAQWQVLCDKLVSAGTFIPLAQPANSHLVRSDPSDVARVEDRTYICSRRQRDAGPTNNWMAPAEMKSRMRELFDRSMSGRTMYVVPFCMGPLDADEPNVGVEITDSEYVVGSMLVMTRAGAAALRLLEERGSYVQCLHSVGAPLAPGQQDVPWPANPVKYISHFPEERAIWSFGSGYGGNALLGKKCYALRIASVLARDEGWLAEHMLVLKLTDPAGSVRYIAAAFPSACGKTNLAMIEPTLPGWRAEVIGDDIAWLRFGEDGRLYATNPEFGLFGVAPGTGFATNPNAMRTIAAGNTIFTNVAATDDGGVWWEGRTPDAPEHLVDWKGRDWTPTGDWQGIELESTGQPAAHPNARFCTPIEQCPVLADEFNSPEGVPISAIVFGGRRKTTIPLVTEAFSWQHGVFLGATLSSETTAAAVGAVGVVRRDPMAMLPFLGYDAGDYFAHWLSMGGRTGPDLLPRIFYVNWFRRDENGGFLWPGYGENSRVLKWITQRLDGTVAARPTPAGNVAYPGDIDLSGLDVSADSLAAALRVDGAEWKAELPLIREWFSFLGPSVPAELAAELAELEARLR